MPTQPTAEMSAATAAVTKGQTPGPWTLQKADGRFFLYGADGSSIATVHELRNAMPAGPAQANARLIAAAPELLEALEALAVEGRDGPCFDMCHTLGLQEHAPACEKARAALAAARAGAK